MSISSITTPGGIAALTAACFVPAAIAGAACADPQDEPRKFGLGNLVMMGLTVLGAAAPVAIGAALIAQGAPLLATKPMAATGFLVGGGGLAAATGAFFGSQLRAAFEMQSPAI